MELKILLVEDEELIGEMVRLNLQGEGYRVCWAKDGLEAHQAVCGESFDLILLDIMLPGADGIQLTREWRRLDIHTPVLLLTARNDVRTKVLGLDSGADDYVTKPFNMPELLARVRAAIRRSQGARETRAVDQLRFGQHLVNLQTREADTNEGRLTLSEKEIQLLSLFAARPGEVLTRADILDEVWGMDVSPTERTVDNFIVRLRRLFDDPQHPRHILTVRGSGYCFLP